MKILVPFLLFSLARCQWLSDCGKSKYENPAPEQETDDFQRIVGGWESRKNEFPYQLRIDLFGNHHCGAVLINSNWCLTAAHCVPSGTPNGLKLYAGAHIVSEPSSSQQESDVLQVINHPKFNDPLMWSNDISLLRIASPFSLNENVTAACKPQNETYINKTVTLSGWGGTFSGDLPTDEFRYTNVDVVSDESCSIPYPGQLDESMICAARLGRDTCQGDSGGPMAYNRDGRFEIIGITSWGRGCALPTHPGVYAKVSHQLQWIKENTS